MEKRSQKMGLEDIGDGTFDSDHDIFLASIAVSLKRIADTIAGDDTHMGLIDTLFEIKGLLG